EYPDPEPDQVLVKLFSSGVCHSQLHQIHSRETHTPILLGHEATGIVEAKGKGVTHVKEGDHVIVTWVPRDAKPGMSPAPQASINWGGKPFTQPGVFTWAQHCLVAERYVVPIPKSVATDVTSIIGCAILTGAGAVINTAKVQRGESVAVFGVGGVGMSAIQAAANVGANPIIAVDLDDEKLAFAKRFGATHGVNSSKVNAIEEIIALTNGGVDYAFDAIGVPQTQEQILLATRPGILGYGDGGMSVLIGIPQTQVSFDMRLAVRGQKIYRGSWGGNTRPERDFPMYIDWFQGGKLPLNELVTQRYKLEQINEAVRDLEQGKIFGRSIIEF
ncbi:MAG: zinc-binding dehydrogenase, partial [Candidatus Tectomicrobia bacterium]|nr:zinc-binding dehydrogenase [Candidatus Tectomicrobia bacterium]